LLPNGRGYEAYSGARLGKDRWQVLSVEADFLLLCERGGTKCLRLKRAGR
jgi:hypothetical protein